MIPSKLLGKRITLKVDPTAKSVIFESADPDMKWKETIDPIKARYLEIADMRRRKTDNVSGCAVGYTYHLNRLLLQTRVSQSAYYFVGLGLHLADSMVSLSR